MTPNSYALAAWGLLTPNPKEIRACNLEISDILKKNETRHILFPSN